MTNQHPFTPPPELVDLVSSGAEAAIATKILQWAAPILRQQGADQELEACCEWVRSMFDGHPTWADELLADRRPKPPSLKEQAHDAYWVLRYGHGGDINETQKWNIIRRALEGLDD